MSSLVAQKSSMNRRTLMRQNLRRSVQPTNPHQVQVSRSVATKETNKEQIKQRAIKEMTKTWESSTNISKDNDKNTMNSLHLYLISGNTNIFSLFFKINNPN